MPDHHFLSDLLALLVASIGAAVAMRALGQSTILGYLVTGLLIGPAALGLLHGESIATLAEVGVSLLLFTIGIELSPAQLAKIRRIAVGGGSLQVGATALVFALAAGIATGRPLEAAFLGCAVALSSSAIILKTLADRGDLDAPYTSATTGVAIFQDIATLPMMVILPALALGGSGAAGGGAPGLADLALPVLAALGRAAAILAILYVASRFIVDRFLYAVARTRSPEVFILAVAALILAAAYGAALAGLSLALGAFVGGIMLAESKYSHQILADVTPFRGVFQAIFFVSIGMLIDVRWALAHLGLVAAATAAVIAGKTLVAALALAAVGVPARVATATGIVLSSIGEFSLLIVAQGHRLGAIGDDAYQLALAASFGTMALAPPLIANVRRIVDLLARALPGGLGKKLAGASDERLAAAAGALSGHVIICGFGPVGRDVAMFCLDHGVGFVAIELNPKTVKEFSEKGIRIFFGDFSNAVVLEQAGVAHARALVVAAPDTPSAVRAIRTALGLHPGLEVVARTKYRGDVEKILAAGAKEVVEEEFETALEMVARLSKGLALPRAVVAEHMAGQRLERYGLEDAAPPPPA